MINSQTCHIHLGEDFLTLQKTLIYLLNKNTPLNIKFYSPILSSSQRLNIQFNLIKIASTHPYFNQIKTLNIDWHTNLSELEFSQNDIFIPIPESVTQDGSSDIELIFADSFVDELETNEEIQNHFSESILEQILEIESNEIWINPSECQDLIYEEIKELLDTPNNQWKSCLSRSSTLQYYQIWKFGLLHAWRSEIQEVAIKRLTQDTNDIIAHLVLSIFKKYYDSTPEPIQEFIDFWKGKHAGYIKILKPLEDFNVTYIVTTYNRLKTLKRTIDSIIEQKDASWNLSILDHGSNKDTQDYLNQVKEKYPLKTRLFRKNKNTGSKAIFQHLQELISKAETELVCFCSDDDFLWENHLEESLYLFKEYPWLGMVYGGKQLQFIQTNYKQKVNGGPFYLQSQIIDPQVELQRIIRMRSASPHFIIRKSILEEVAAIDPYTPLNAKYGFHDTLTHIYSISHVEVGCVNQITSTVTLNTETAFMQEDISSTWLLMARITIQKYLQIFGEGYPIYPIKHLVEGLFTNSTEDLNSAWEKLEQKKAFQNQLEVKMKFYQEAFDFKQNLIPICSEQTPFLFEKKHPYEPYIKEH